MPSGLIWRKIKSVPVLYNFIFDSWLLYRRVLLTNDYIGTIRNDFKHGMGYDLDLKTPKTFTEKLQWLKVFYRDPIIPICSDKIAVKEFVKERIGEEYLVPEIAEYDNCEDIKWELLPQQFVLKPNHTSGIVVVCKDKKSIDIARTCQELSRSLKRNAYYQGGEWQYKDIKPKILCEEFLGEKIIDYKFFCFNGEPKFLYVSYGLKDHATAYMDYLNMDWTLASFKRNDYMHFPVLPDKPRKFREMVAVAKKLSRGFPFVRVDLYYFDDKVLFSELTFSPANGFQSFDPEEYNNILGDMLDLTKVDSRFVRQVK